MRRIVLAAVLAALGAAGAVSAPASAAEPAFYECAKVARGGHGEYAEKLCKEGEQHGAGKYELVEGIGKSGKVALGTGPLELIAEPSEVPLNCEKASFRAVLRNPTTLGEAVIVMRGCSVEGKWECTGVGAKRGQIEIGPLSGSLGYIDREAKQVGVGLAGEKARPLAEYSCPTMGPGTFRLDGSIVFAVTGDVNTVAKPMTLTGGFEASKGGSPTSSGSSPNRGTSKKACG